MTVGTVETSSSRYFRDDFFDRSCRSRLEMFVFPLLLLVLEEDVAGVMVTDGVLLIVADVLFVDELLVLPLLAVDDGAIIDNGIVMNCGGPVLPPEHDFGKKYM